MGIELWTTLRRILLIGLLVSIYSGCSNPVSDGSTKLQPIALPDLSFSQSAKSVEVYDFIEVTIDVVKPTAKNPFREIFVTGKFEAINRAGAFHVEGFCDSPNGTVFRIRFMPTEPGEYVYSVAYWQDNLSKKHSGTFKAVNAKRRGAVAIDDSYPWHFIWKGTGEHYFLNGTTAFLLMGWEDEEVIRQSIDRLQGLNVNRVRVMLDGRMDPSFIPVLGEPLKPSAVFRIDRNPWDKRRPGENTNSDTDFTRFDVPHWKRFERMLKYAREKDVVISVIMGWGEISLHPAAGSEDERRYMRYAVARLAAYSNVTWDLGDDLDRFRDAAWTHEVGILIHDLDPYHHVATSHPVDNWYQDRSSDWFGMTSFQQWKRPLHDWMLEQRKQQAATGRIIPQVNEEYGYEDHYPKWAPYEPPAASADGNRRAAWEITMAGGYQTTGETAKRGTGMGSDTGGGFLNGRGDDSMVMLRGYAHMVEFFTGLEWWKTEPHDELVNNGSYCLAEPGRVYIIYLPHGGSVTARLELGRYEARWFNPRSGEYAAAGIAQGPEWNSPNAPDRDDWVILLRHS